MQKGDKIESKNPVDFKTWEKLVIGALIILIVIGPYLFTQLSSGISFSDTGAIGDTIGGITAPFVNLLAAFLVYKSFTAQILANKQQREDHDIQMEQLKKEHTFNYISNYFELIKTKYSLDYELQNKNLNHLKTISGLVTDVVNAINFLERKTDNQDALAENKKTEREKNLERKRKRLNTDIELYLNPLHDQVLALITFDKEKIKSSLDRGISDFYHLEIQQIINTMNLHEIIKGKLSGRINEIENQLSIDNKKTIGSIKTSCMQLEANNYQLKN